MKLITLLTVLGMTSAALANYDGRILLRCVNVGRTSDYFGDLKTITVVEHQNRTQSLVQEGTSGRVVRTSLEGTELQLGLIELSTNGALGRYLTRETGVWELLHIDCDESRARVTCTEY